MVNERDYILQTQQEQLFEVKEIGEYIFFQNLLSSN